MQAVLRRCRAIVVLLALALLPAAWAQAPLPPALRPWSRSASQTADAFYFQPEIVGEDYPQATAEQVARDLALVRRAGARALRFGVSWLETEPEPGHFDWSKLDILIGAAAQLNMPVLPYLCYTPKWAATEPDDRDFWAQPPKDPAAFARFAAAVATRYRGKVLAWGLWNEADGVYWKGSPEQLATMIREASAAIRAADPGAGVWMGGLAEGADAFFDRIVEKDRADRSVNAIGLHGYPGTCDARSPGQYYPQQLHAMRQVLDSLHDPVDLWADENGYADYRYSPRSASRDVKVPVIYAYEHTRAYQAVMLWRDHLEVLASGEASLMGWYRLHDLPAGANTIGDENNRFLGLVDVNGREKPAFAALRFYDELFNQPTRSLDAKITTAPRDAASQAVVHVIERRDGQVVVTGWLRPPGPRAAANSDGYAQDKRDPVRLEVHFPPGAAFRRIRTYTVTGKLVSERALPPSTGPFVLRDLVVDGRTAAITVLLP